MEYLKGGMNDLLQIASRQQAKLDIENAALERFKPHAKRINGGEILMVASPLAWLGSFRQVGVIVGAEDAGLYPFIDAAKFKALCVREEAVTIPGLADRVVATGCKHLLENPAMLPAQLWSGTLAAIEAGRKVIPVTPSFTGDPSRSYVMIGQ